jgi:diacylglycerol kinase (ATP)
MRVRLDRNVKMRAFAHLQGNFTQTGGNLRGLLRCTFNCDVPSYRLHQIDLDSYEVFIEEPGQGRAMRRVTLFHNPTAGDGSHEGDELIECLRKAGFEPNYNSTKGEYKPALRDPGEIAIVAGGDGTVRKIATHLSDRSVPLAIIPLGTANNIANTLGVAGDSGPLIEGLLTARRQRFDIWEAAGNWGKELFVEGVGFGVFAEVMSALDKQEEQGAGPFLKTADELTIALRALGEALPKFEAVDAEVTLDGQDLSGRYLMLEAMNIRHIGPNLLLAPDADPGDGYLDLVMVEDSQREELAGYFEYRLEGKQDAPLLPVRRGKHLRVNCSRAQFTSMISLCPMTTSRRETRSNRQSTACHHEPPPHLR